LEDPIDRHHDGPGPYGFLAFLRGKGRGAKGKKGKDAKKEKGDQVDKESSGSFRKSGNGGKHFLTSRKIYAPKTPGGLLDIAMGYPPQSPWRAMGRGEMGEMKS
jgi:hypothetical protein